MRSIIHAALTRSTAGAIVLTLAWFVASSVSSTSPPQQTRRSAPGGAFAFPADPTTVVAPIMSGVATYLALVASYDRPQGKLAVDDGCLVAKQSQVPGSGLGLYVTRSMSEGTALGTYPGVIRPAVPYLAKYRQYPECGSYAWRFTDNQDYVDPTDSSGQIRDECFGGSSSIPGSIFFHEKVLRSPVPTLLARINEPPIGGPGCNVYSRQDLEGRYVTFYLSRDVVTGEELFMDYGLTYDRAGYQDPKRNDKAGDADQLQ